MQKNILLSMLLLLLSIGAKAQCPISIIEDSGDASSYTFTLATAAECSNFPILTNLAITNSAGTGSYGIGSCATNFGVTTVGLSFDNGIGIFGNVVPITFMVGALTCTYNAMGVLPIQLASFSGYAKDKTNFLTWTTASESQNKGFDIETSPNPSKGGEFTWRKIGFVAGNETTNTKQDYSFEDKTTFSSPSGRSDGVFYYRLKQLDFDGRFEYSKIIAIDSKGEKVVSVFPNPSKGIFTITGIEDTEDETFTLINSIGQTLSITVQNDGQFDMSAYPMGVYYLRVASSGQVMKLVKE